MRLTSAFFQCEFIITKIHKRPNSLFNPLAVVAYAKGAVAYMAVLQELWFLGSADATDSTLRSFVNRAADWCVCCL